MLFKSFKVVIVGITLLTTLCAEAKEIVVGQVAPFTGPLASTGKGLQLGAKIYLDAVNAQGGINGAKIRVVSKDDGYKIDATVKGVKELIANERPIAFFGLVGTGNVEALMKDGILAKSDIPVVGPRTGATSLRNPAYSYLFHVRVDYRQETAKMLEQVIPFGIKKVAVLYQNDGFGKDGLAGIEAAMDKQHLQLVAKASYEKNTTDMSAAVKTLAKAAPQAIFLMSNTAATAEFVKQYRAVDIGAQLITLSVTDPLEVVDKIGIEAARGLGIVMVAPHPKKRGVALVDEFQRNLFKYAPSGTEPSSTILEGYITARVLVEGLRRAEQDHKKSLLKALQSIQHFDLGGFQINFDNEKHSGSTFVDIGVIGSDGKIKI